MTTTKTRNTASPCRSITSRDSLQFSLQAKSISRFAFLMIWRIVSAMECSSSTARTLSTCCQLLRLSPGNTFQVTFYDGIFKFPCVFQDQLCFYVSNSQFTHFAIFSIFFSARIFNHLYQNLSHRQHESVRDKFFRVLWIATLIKKLGNVALPDRQEALEEYIRRAKAMNADGTSREPRQRKRAGESTSTPDIQKKRKMWLPRNRAIQINQFL